MGGGSNLSFALLASVIFVPGSVYRLNTGLEEVEEGVGQSGGKCQKTSRNKFDVLKAAAGYLRHL